MSTEGEREETRRAIAEEQRQLEEEQRALTRAIETGDTTYVYMADEVARRRRNIERLTRNLRGKQEILDHPDKTIAQLIEEEEQQVAQLREARDRELNRTPPNQDALRQANQRVREAEEVQDGKRHVRERLMPRPGGPGYGVEFGFFDSYWNSLFSVAFKFPAAGEVSKVVEAPQPMASAITTELAPREIAPKPSLRSDASARGPRRTQRGLENRQKSRSTTR